MKKIELLLCLITLTSVMVHAQFQLGPSASFNLANVAFKDTDSEKYNTIHPAYAFGLAVEYGFSDAFGLRSGLLYESKGYNIDVSKQSLELVTYEGYARYSFDYIEFPVSVTYKIKGVELAAGPYIAFGIGGRFKYDFTRSYNGQENIEEGDIELDPFIGKVEEDELNEHLGAYNGFDYGLNFSLGYQAGPVLISAGYSLGLDNMNADMVLQNYDYDRSRNARYNRIISFTACYLFKIDKGK